MSDSKTAARGRSRPAREGLRHSPTQTKRRKGDGESDAVDGEEEYAGAFARVRLVRAWVGAVAALIGLLMAFVALLERLTP